MARDSCAQTFTGKHIFNPRKDGNGKEFFACICGKKPSENELTRAKIGLKETAAERERQRFRPVPVTHARYGRTQRANEAP